MRLVPDHLLVGELEVGKLHPWDVILLDNSDEILDDMARVVPTQLHSHR